LLPVVGIFLGIWLNKFIYDGELKKIFWLVVLLMGISTILKEYFYTQRNLIVKVVLKKTIMLHIQHFIYMFVS